jgi:hypothetical protein
MTDFASAFRLGQDAAIKSRAARESISNLLQQVSDDLNAATDGTLVVEVRTFNDLVDNVASFLGAMASPPRYKNARYLAAANVKRNRNEFFKLAKWTQAEEGYPCSLEFGKQEITCYDIESLQAALTEMLANASVGEKLANILRAL